MRRSLDYGLVLELCSRESVATDRSGAQAPVEELPYRSLRGARRNVPAMSQRDLIAQIATVAEAVADSLGIDRPAAAR